MLTSLTLKRTVEYNELEVQHISCKTNSRSDMYILQAYMPLSIMHTKQAMPALQIPYSTVVLYIGVMKVWGFWPEIISPKST